MDRRLARSTYVTETLTMAMPRSEPARATLEALYRSSRDDVYAYVATLLRDPAAAEDVTATAFERAFRRRRSFNPRRGSPRGWLFGIARNAALDELRRRSRQATLAADPEDLDAAAAEDPEHILRRTTVRTAIAGLTPREREIVALKFHAGLSQAELAEVLGVSPSNAGTLVHRTMEKLREACYVAS